MAEKLVKSGKVVRVWLGVSIQTMCPAIADALGLTDTKGAVIGEVLPAARSGVSSGEGDIANLGLQVAPLSPQLRQKFAIPEALQRGGASSWK